MQTSDNKTLLIKYPTRQRPAKFMANLNAYIQKASAKHKLIFIISMDKDDISLNNPAIHKFLNSKNNEFVEIRYSYGESLGKIHAINRDIPDEPWDIIMSIADDMEPVDTNWDDIIVTDMLNNFSDLNGSLNYNNDPRLDDKGFTTLITLPIIGRKLYDKFGYIYHPSYKSEWCDNEQTLVFEQLKVLKHIDKRPIVHKWAENQDALMHRNMQIGFSFDKTTFEQRKANNFGLLIGASA